MRTMNNEKIMRQNIKVIRQQEFIKNTTVWVNKTLFRRYCQSQNYYYTRDINEILAEATSKAVVRFKDNTCYDDDDEYLKRTYQLEEYPQKIVLLTEYYKFHTDIARIFMEPIATILNKYYDKKRKFEYYRIARLIEEENKNNPTRPPKGIVGEKPSPANSHESEQEDIPEPAIKQQKLKEMLVLKDLSFLCEQSSQFMIKQDYQSHIPKKRMNEQSCTLQEICKHMGNLVQQDQSSLFIGQNGKQDDIQLDKFLHFLNKKSQNLNQKQQQQQQQQTLKSNSQKMAAKKFSQPQEYLIQQIIQSQLSQQKMQSDDMKHRLGSQHNSKENQLHLKQSTSLGSQFNFVRNQLENNSYQKSSKQQSSDAPQSSTRIEMKNNDNLKTQTSQKAKTITGHQPKISNQLFLKDFKANLQSNTQRNNINPYQSPQNYHQKTQTQINNPTKLNLKQIAKLFIEEEVSDQELKWKNGSQTHRPMSGTQNFFNSNRNSPGLNNINQKANPLFTDQNFKFMKGKTSHQPQTKSLNKPNPLANQISRKSTQPNIHIRQTSNQERIININININEHPEYLKSKNINKKVEKSQQSKHKKHFSDGKALLIGKVGDSQLELGCLTERGGSSEFLFKNTLNSQSSPKGQLKRVNSGAKIMPSSMHSTSTRGSLIQTMMNQVSKQNNCYNSKQDFLQQLGNFQKLG